MQAQITVDFKGEEYSFNFKIHKSLKSEDQQIEKDFYEKWSNAHKVYEGTHFEVEILSSELGKHEYASKLHIHLSEKNNKNFICWTGHVKTEPTVVMLITMWCQGNVYTLKTGEDFAHLYERHSIPSNDFDGMSQLLTHEYSITTPVSKFDFK